MQESILLRSRVLFSRREFSTLTGLSLRTIAKLIASRELKSILVGRRRLIPRSELARFIRRDHRIGAPSTAALRLRSGNRKIRKPLKKRKTRGGNGRRVNQKRRSPRKRGRVRPQRIGPAITDPRVARGLGLMRREGVSASEAARRERMKLETFRRRAGRYLYRSGPGKPWKARSEDQLAFSMTVLTSRGPLDAVIHNSRERRLLHRYEVALRMFRAGEDGVEAALKAFKGKSVGGHKLITDTKLLIELEEAGLLDFGSLYTSFGARS